MAEKTGTCNSTQSKIRRLGQAERRLYRFEKYLGSPGEVFYSKIRGGMGDVLPTYVFFVLTAQI